MEITLNSRYLATRMTHADSADAETIFLGWQASSKKELPRKFQLSGQLPIDYKRLYNLMCSFFSENQRIANSFSNRNTRLS